MEIKNEALIKKDQENQQRDNLEPEMSERKITEDTKIQEDQEYSDIMLSSNSNNAVNKKKYLILGLVLVILFLLTIIIIRLVNNDSTQNDSFAKSSEEKSEQTVASENIEEQYQKIINEKLKNIQEEKEAPVAVEEKILQEKTAELKTTEEKIVETVEKTKELYVAPKKVALEEPKIIPIKKITPKANTSLVTTKPKGTFIQIGAFSKMPNNKYLSNITKNGFSYNIYKVNINNSLFHKVLIGPYNSKKEAKADESNVKKKLKISGTYVLTF